MAYGRKASFEAVREAAFGSIGAAYATLGAVTGENVRILMAYNTTDVDVYLSFDGSANHLRVPSGGGLTFDFTANEVRNDGLFLPTNTQIYQKRVSGAPTTGAVWVQLVYARGGM